MYAVVRAGACLLPPPPLLVWKSYKESLRYKRLFLSPGFEFLWYIKQCGCVCVSFAQIGCSNLNLHAFILTTIACYCSEMLMNWYRRTEPTCLTFCDRFSSLPVAILPYCQPSVKCDQVKKVNSSPSSLLLFCGQDAKKRISLSTRFDIHCSEYWSKEDRGNNRIKGRWNEKTQE